MTEKPIYAPTTPPITPNGEVQLQCNSCGKTVSSLLIPVKNELGNDLIVRAWIECPECIEIEAKK